MQICNLYNPLLLVNNLHFDSQCTSVCASLKGINSLLHWESVGYKLRNVAEHSF